MNDKRPNRKGDKVVKCDELKQEENPIEWGLYYDKSEVDAAIAELKARIHEQESMPHTDNSAVIERLSNENERLKAKLESVQATAYTESVDAGMRERKLKRALYKACANWAKSEQYTEATWHGDDHREELWANVQAKCIKKADEYK